MSKIQFIHSYDYLISLDNLLEAWKEFIKGKRKRKDVQKFKIHLMDNVLSLHNDLANRSYIHGCYQSFYITDPKLRHIHKATVRDRLLHHAIYRQLYPFFNKTFIFDSYSCRLGKGTHRAIARLREMASIVSRNNTKDCFILKCDIKKFFDSIDHSILLNILEGYILDKEIVNLLKGIISSFEVKEDKGLPLGNLTSQLFVNIYMNKFDQFIKHRLKTKYYIRYADDFVLITDDKAWLAGKVSEIKDFLNKELKLNLHPQKLFLSNLNSGVDFLGWVNFPYHLVLRTKSRKRMLKKIQKSTKEETLNSYLGLLKHGNAFELSRIVKDYYLSLIKGN